MKKWLSRGIVLAMVMALMIPAPVLAKSSKSGGKLIKSVECYSYNTQKNRWEKEYKDAYKYDKKNNPKEIRETWYEGHVLGIPTRSEISLQTLKYKYKGKTPKSMQANDGQIRKYKSGRAIYIDGTTYYSDANDNTVTNAQTVDVSYNKEGLVTAVSTKYSNSSAGESGTNSFTYAITQKKGIPSLILATYGGGTYTDPEEGSGTNPASTTPWAYTKFNGKGLVVESGTITDAGAYEPDTWVEYTKKKGKITKATVFRNTYDYKGNLTGTRVPYRIYKFKYGKKKISKVRYLNMMNDLVGFGYNNGDGEARAFFCWY